MYSFNKYLKIKKKNYYYLISFRFISIINIILKNIKKPNKIWR